MDLTFEDELAALARARVTPEERQDACIDILKRHLDSVSLTDVMLMKHFEHRFYCELALRGKRWDHKSKAEVDSYEGALMPTVRLRSLVRAKGKAQAINGVKVGPPYPGSRAQNRERDVKGLPRYPTRDFEVDAESGDFREELPIDLARVLLQNHGAHLRWPRYSTRYPAGYSHRAPTKAQPVQVDEWILGEVKHLDKTTAKAKAAKPMTILVVE